MPAGVGYPGGRRGSGLAASALARQGTPQPGIIPTGAPDRQALSEIMQMLRGGQVGAERFMQLLSLLASRTTPQMGGGGQGQRPQQGRGPQRPQPQQGRGGRSQPQRGQTPSIQQLLG